MAPPMHKVAPPLTRSISFLFLPCLEKEIIWVFNNLSTITAHLFIRKRETLIKKKKTFLLGHKVYQLNVFGP